MTIVFYLLAKLLLQQNQLNWTGLPYYQNCILRQNSLAKKEVLYCIAHRKYETSTIRLSEMVPSFEKKPTFDGLRDLLNTSKECIESYKAQSGWQFYQDSEYTNQNWRNRKTLLEQSKQEHQGFLETIKSALSVIFINVPENYKDFCELVEDYYTYFDSLTDEVRLSGLIEIINKCPENIDFNQKPKFDDVTPDDKVFEKID